MSKTFDDVPSRYIVKMSGKRYITHDGLMWLADQRGGIERMWTELWREDDGWLARAYILPSVDFDRLKNLGESAQVKALELLSQPYVAHAIANSSNVTKLTSTAMERMAETRALNRVLRMFLRTGETTWEELPEALPDDEPPVEPSVPEKGPPKVATKESEEPDEDVESLMVQIREMKDRNETTNNYYQRVMKPYIDGQRPLEQCFKAMPYAEVKGLRDALHDIILGTEDLP